MGNNQSKLVEYAYPSSTTATKAGFGQVGCWFVSLYNPGTIRAKILKYFNTKKDAVVFADSLPHPYNWMHKYE